MKVFKNIALLLLVLIIGAGEEAVAQQDPMYSMYMFDKMLINPAYTGSADWMVGTAKHRSQFVGMADGPSTQTLNFHSPIKSRYVGLGFKVINDRIAIMKNLNASAFYSYHLNLGGGKFSIGLETGIYNRTINYNELVVTDLADNALPTNAVSALVPDASWGVYYQKEQFYMGFAQNHIIKARFKDNVDGVSDSHLFTHTNFIIGNVFDFKGKWSLETSSLMKSVQGSPTQFDVNAVAYYDDMVGVGAQFRTGDAVSAILRVHVNESIRISYAYDVTISELSTYSNGAHELVVSYGVKLPPPRTEKEIHPRYYY